MSEQKLPNHVWQVLFVSGPAMSGKSVRVDRAMEGDYDLVKIFTTNPEKSPYYTTMEEINAAEFPDPFSVEAYFHNHDYWVKAVCADGFWYGIPYWWMGVGTQLVIEVQPMLLAEIFKLFTQEGKLSRTLKVNDGKDVIFADFLWCHKDYLEAKKENKRRHKMTPAKFNIRWYNDECNGPTQEQLDEICYFVDRPDLLDQSAAIAANKQADLEALRELGLGVLAETVSEDVQEYIESGQGALADAFNIPAA